MDRGRSEQVFIVKVSVHGIRAHAMSRQDLVLENLALPRVGGLHRRYEWRDVA